MKFNFDIGNSKFSVLYYNFQVPPSGGGGIVDKLTIALAALKVLT